MFGESSGLCPGLDLVGSRPPAFHAKKEIISGEGLDNSESQIAVEVVQGWICTRCKSPCRSSRSVVVLSILVQRFLGRQGVWFAIILSHVTNETCGQGQHPRRVDSLPRGPVAGTRELVE